jgi:hypothetical protein
MEVDEDNSSQKGSKIRSDDCGLANSSAQHDIRGQGIATETRTETMLSPGADIYPIKTSATDTRAVPCEYAIITLCSKCAKQTNDLQILSTDDGVYYHWPVCGCGFTSDKVFTLSSQPLKKDSPMYRCLIEQLLEHKKLAAEEKKRQLHFQMKQAKEVVQHK